MPTFDGKPGQGDDAFRTDRAERREARTGDPLLALSRLFESARRRAGLAAIVLADDSGLTIAGAGPAWTCDDLAARGAIVSAARAANDTVPCRLDVLSRAMDVRRLRIDGIEVLLCSAAADTGRATEGLEDAGGERHRARADELSEAASGCERILGRRPKSRAEA